MYLICGLLFIACAKDEGMLLMQAPAAENPAPEADAQTQEGLIQNSDGTWTAVGRRVPLVGAGRFVDNIFPDLVEVLGAKEGLNNITDLDITNSADFSGVAGVNLFAGNQIVSVKDMYRTYSEGQQVGFVLKNTSSTFLDVSVLELFVITLYKDNKQVGEPFQLGSEEGTGLKLDLVKLTSGGSNGLQTISVEAWGDFDEVAIGMAGAVDAEVLNDTGIGVLYAFVGDNEEEYLYSDQGLSMVDGLGWEFMPGQNTDKIITRGDNDGVAIPTVLIKYATLTVDFGNMTFDPGTELGFTYDNGGLLDLSVLNMVELTPYDSAGEEIAEDKLESMGVLGLNVIKAGEGAYSLTVSTNRTKRLKFHTSALGLDFGAMTLKRVYKRDPVVLDPTSYFTVQKEVYTSKSSYRFMTPLAEADGSVGTVTLTVDGGAEVDQLNRRITDMQPGHSYNVTAVYSGKSGSFTSESVIHCIKDTAPDITYMVESEGFGLGDINSSGITILTSLKNPENIVNDATTDAATFVRGVGLIEINTGIAAVEKTDGNTVKPEDGQVLRVGFALQANSELLSLDVLDFFRIRFYKDGQLIDEPYVSAENESVSLGLLAGSRQIMVNAYTEKEFDHVELVTSGVASVSLSSLKIYYAYYEPVADMDAEQGGIRDFCLDKMTPATHGLWIDYDNSDFSLVSVGSAMSDMTNMLDDDNEETYAVVTEAVNLAGSARIRVNFDPITTRQWIGMIVRNPQGIADVDLLNASTLHVYNGDIKTESATQSFSGLASLGLIGYGDYSYLEIYPTVGNTIDGLELEVGGLGQVLSNIQIYGVYMRPDSDGDGIPDCSEDETAENDPDSMTAEKNEYHVCSGSCLVIGVTGGVIDDDENDDEKYNYELSFTDLDKTIPITATLSEDREFVITTGENGQLSEGQYTLDIAPAEPATGEVTYPTGIKVYVHPSETTWSGDSSSEWNDWSNWVEGAPWTCSNVVIPGGCSNYPVLKASDNAVCRNIQFAPGGEVAGTQYLDYEKAWVNVALPNGEYSMFSSPLKETYTGDMFISEYEYADEVIPADLGATEDGSVDYGLCWLPLNGSTYPVDRFSPKVYQRAWNRAVQSSGMDGYYDVDLDSEYWTEPYNLVSDPYIAGHGILIRPDEEGKGSGESVFCLPKEYDEYEYYDLVSQTMTGRKDAVERTEKYVGRFIYEDASGNASFPMHVLLENERPSDTYLAGNPFMCHIDLEQFFYWNPAVCEVKFLVKDGDQYKYETVTRDASAETVGPAEGFLVKVGGVYAETSRFRLYIHFTEDMMVTAPQQ